MTPVAILRKRFQIYSWGLLGYNLLVILWGAYVRATGSGAGCGAHWPTCQGQVVPLNAGTHTLIEFTHRLMSGLTLVGVILLVWMAFRHYPRRHRVRTGALYSLAFTLSEAVVGAGLVLFGLTAENDSAARAIVISIHLVNTFLLLAALAVTAWWASGGDSLRLRGKPTLAPWLGISWALLFILGASGAITALGDTLFPSGSLIEGMQQDLSPTSHFLLRLRIYHPVIAVITALATAAMARKGMALKPTKWVRRVGTGLVVMLGVQLLLGFTNVILLAPVWMQMLHLLAADLVWIGLVLFSAAVLEVERVTVRAGVELTPSSDP